MIDEVLLRQTYKEMLALQFKNMRHEPAPKEWVDSQANDMSRHLTISEVVPEINRRIKQFSN